MLPDPRDVAMQETVPTIMVPLFGELEPMKQSGHRYLSAADGLWCEIKRPWTHMILPVARQTEFTMPYGSLSKKISFAFTKIPEDLMDRFIDAARRVFPYECAAFLVWDEHQNKLVYRQVKTIKADASNLKFTRPELMPHESLAVELHSHGRHPAFFSQIDNADDRNEVKISGVIGSLDKEMTAAFRICTGGSFIKLGSSGLRG